MRQEWAEEVLGISRMRNQVSWPPDSCIFQFTLAPLSCWEVLLFKVHGKKPLCYSKLWCCWYYFHFVVHPSRTETYRHPQAIVQAPHFRHHSMGLLVGKGYSLQQFNLWAYFLASREGNCFQWGQGSCGCPWDLLSCYAHTQWKKECYQAGPKG